MAAQQKPSPQTEPIIAAPPPLRQAPEKAPSGDGGRGTVEGFYGFPLTGTTHKVIHLIRHGQATSNAAAGGAKSHPAYTSWEYFDAALSPLGEKQAQELGAKIGKSLKPELIVVSPLSRAIMTARRVFGPHPKFLANDLARERTGVHPCDKRRKVSELQATFKRVDFSLIEHDDDVQWKENQRETPEELAHRVKEFLHWLKQRKEKDIAVVGHSGFFESLFNHVLQTFDPRLRQWMDNCELRSIHLVFSPDGIVSVKQPARL